MTSNTLYAIWVGNTFETQIFAKNEREALITAQSLYDKNKKIKVVEVIL